MKSRVLLQFFIGLATVLTSALLVEAWQISQYGDRASERSADAAIVLGAAAWGSKPSPVYRERIAQAVRLYEAGCIHWIIYTGGTSAIGFPSEAQVGRQYSVAKGVPVAATLVDEDSRTTWQNLENAAGLMKRNQIRSVLLVSDPLHMQRAMVMASDLGLAAAPAPTTTSRFLSWTSRARFLWRETWLYLAYEFAGIKD